MVGLDRRSVLASIAAIGVVPHAAWAEEFIDLDWDDLLPLNDTQTAVSPQGLGLLDHSNLPVSPAQPVSTGVRDEWNGKVVRLPGFVVPIDQKGTAVTAFILVPYAGACVHVPPPPANQLVFVTAQTPYQSEGLYSPVNVTGMFGVSSISTQLADVGYALSADKIEPYG